MRPSIRARYRGAGVAGIILLTGFTWLWGGGLPPEPAPGGRYRILLRVPPGERDTKTDEMPARISLNFEDLLRNAGAAGRADLSTLRVVRYDPASGKPLPYGKFLYGETEADRPLQWYDDAIPDPFADRDRSVKSPWVARPLWGSHYEATGTWKSGKLAFTHTAEPGGTSYYAVYFGLLGEKEKQKMPAPRGWIGDGSKRSARVGTQSTGIYHTDCQMTDLNRDGLQDVVCGSSRGGIVWYENTGTRRVPEFTIARLLFQSDGHAIDPGFLSTPTVTDWDADGKPDLLVGADKGWIYFYRNVGTVQAPVYEDKGPLQVDGQELRTPASPVPEVAGPKGESIYTADYQPYCAIADWDGDGDDDLLVGGNVTGRIYWYENVGRGSDSTPRLHFRGHLLADGKPLDVGWSANLTVQDIDGDGDLDILSGHERKWGNETPPEIVEDFLAYFENIGTRTSPKLTMKPLPRVAKLPVAIGASPSLADWDGDGDLDLAVSTYQGPLYLIENVGTAQHPKFDARKLRPLQFPWGSDALPDSRELQDWNGDGIPDLLQGHMVALGTTNRLPWRFGPFRSLLPEGQEFDHRAWRGDDWIFTVAVDFDQDGRKDILFGDYWGHVWFHRNTTEKGAEPSFDLNGVLIKTAQGSPVRVGLTTDKPYDFDTMQGPRTSMVAADFDGDGSVDLVVNDVYGHYYFCRRGKHGKEPVVESQVLFAEVGTYAFTTVFDENGDGRPDLLASLPRVQNHLLFRNPGADGGPKFFAPPEKFELPPVPVIGSVVRVMFDDVNRDGDRDAVLSTEEGSFLFEGSFLRHGYRNAEFVKLERIQP